VQIYKNNSAKLYKKDNAKKKIKIKVVSKEICEYLYKK